jgi:hypothetical protein
MESSTGKVTRTKCTCGFTSNSPRPFFISAELKEIKISVCPVDHLAGANDSHNWRTKQLEPQILALQRRADRCAEIERQLEKYQSLEEQVAKYKAQAERYQAMLIAVGCPDVDSSPPALDNPASLQYFYSMMTTTTKLYMSAANNLNANEQSVARRIENLRNPTGKHAKTRKRLFESIEALEKDALTSSEATVRKYTKKPRSDPATGVNPKVN